MNKKGVFFIILSSVIGFTMLQAFIDGNTEHGIIRFLLFVVCISFSINYISKHKDNITVC